VQHYLPSRHQYPMMIPIITITMICHYYTSTAATPLPLPLYHPLPPLHPRRHSLIGVLFTRYKNWISKYELVASHSTHSLISLIAPHCTIVGPSIIMLFKMPHLYTIIVVFEIYSTSIFPFLLSPSSSFDHARIINSYKLFMNFY
jgi:hypothetical protein